MEAERLENLSKVIQLAKGEPRNRPRQSGSLTLNSVDSHHGLLYILNYLL